MSEKIKEMGESTLENIEFHLYKALALAREIEEPTLEYFIEMGVEVVSLRSKKLN